MANFVNLTSIAGTDGQTLTAGSALWVLHTSYTGVMHVLSSRAYHDNSTTSAYYYNVAPGSANQTVQAAMYTAGSLSTAAQKSVCARVNSAANTMIMARIAVVAGVLVGQLFKAVAGTFTQQSTNVTITEPAAGTTKILKLTVSGQSPNLVMTANWDGTDYKSATINDTNLDATGFVGTRESTGTADTSTTGYHIATFVADDDTAAATDVIPLYQNIGVPGPQMYGLRV